MNPCPRLACNSSGGGFGWGQGVHSAASLDANGSRQPELHISEAVQGSPGNCCAVRQAAEKRAVKSGSLSARHPIPGQVRRYVASAPNNVIQKPRSAATGQLQNGVAANKAAARALADVDGQFMTEE